MKIKKIAVAAVIAIIVVGALALLLQGGNAPPQGNVIKIGYQASAPHALAFIAKEKGFFGQEGLDAELVKFGSANLLMDALAAGNIDAAGVVNFGVLFAMQSASPGVFKVIGLRYYTDEAEWSIVARKNSGLKTLKDLEGKKLGVWPGANVRIVTNMVFEKTGVDANAVRTEQLAPELQLPALESGSVDALFTLEPYNILAVEKGLAYTLVRAPNSLLMKEYPIGGPVVSTRLLENNPAAASKFRKAIERAVDFYKNNREESLEIVSKYVNIDESIRRKLSARQEKTLDELSQNDFESVQTLADAFLKQGALKNRINASEMFLQAFARQTSR